MTTSSLTWATTHQYGANSLAHQFPSFQINASQAGGVRVEARSPSGRLQDMGVVENGGVYTANFTPTEVGKYFFFLYIKSITFVKDIDNTNRML